MVAQNALEEARSQYDDDGRAARTGTLWSCIAHIITAVIGSGVLSIAWSIAQLGWIAGPACLVCFALINTVSCYILADCYRYPHPETGTRNRSYIDAVSIRLGRIHQWFCGFLQYLSMYITAVAYVVTTATSMRAILMSNCYHRKGHGASSPCSYNGSMYMLIFGLIQIVLSQIPAIHNMTWLSVIATFMSFGYSLIGFGLGFAKVVETKTFQGSITGVPAANPTQKIFNSLLAIGDIVFSYPYSFVLLEIQDTLRSQPPENKTMKKASAISMVITTAFYLCCGGFGYAALGNATPGNLLTGFGFYEPYWLLDLANAGVIVHLAAGYQLYSQPVFAFFEGWLSEKYPDSRFMNKTYCMKLPYNLARFETNLLRLCVRTAYVVSTTIIAMVFPYFNQILGVLGALYFWPLAIYFPVEMYLVQNKVKAWSKKWIALRTLSFFCFLISLVGLVGSVEGLIRAKWG